MSHAALATGVDDARHLESLDASGRRVHVVPNGVNIIDCDPEPQESAETCCRLQRNPRIVFSGNMDYTPNMEAAQWFMDEVMPILRLSLIHI